ncbi:hypothetical protein ACWDZW_27450 [Streptomyces coeruleorubidus]
MIVVYIPAGGEPEHYDASTLRVSEASIVQRTVDMKWAEVQEGLERDDLDAMRGVVWVLKKRTQPSLRFGEFDPGITEMTTRMDNKEITTWVDNALAAVGDELSMEEVEQIILDRLPTVAVDPEFARDLVTSRTRAPKDPVAEPQDSGQEATPEAPPSPSPTPTSSEPGTPTSASSPTPSTSHPEMSTP